MGTNCETWEGYWTQDRIDYIRGNGGEVAVVYHAFKAGVWGGNCYAPFNFLNQTEYTNFESYRVYQKGAGCAQEGYHAPGNNEVRIYHTSPWSMQAGGRTWGTRYYVGARFLDMYRATYGSNYSGDVDFTYDNYYLNNDG